MAEYQVNKEIIFNEAVYKFDFLASRTAKAFVDSLSQNAIDGELYILPKREEQKSNVACFINNTWHLFAPLSGAIFYVRENTAFYLLNENYEWEEILINSYEKKKNNLLEETGFKAIGDHYTLDTNIDLFYLYLEDDVEIKISLITYNTTTIFIKQNSSKIYKIKWLGDIIWPDSIPFEASQVRNGLQIIKFHKLIQTNMFLAEVISSVYSI